MFFVYWKWLNNLNSIRYHHSKYVNYSLKYFNLIGSFSVKYSSDHVSRKSLDVSVIVRSVANSTCNHLVSFDASFTLFLCSKEIQVLWKYIVSPLTMQNMREFELFFPLILFPSGLSPCSSVFAKPIEIIASYVVNYLFLSDIDKNVKLKLCSKCKYVEYYCIHDRHICFFVPLSCVLQRK